MAAKFSPGVNSRLAALRNAMERIGTTAAVLQKPETVFYISRFNPIINSSPCFTVVTDNDAFLLVHSLRRFHANAETALLPVYCYGEWGNAMPVAKTAVEAIAKLIGKKTPRLALETNHISFKLAGELKAALGAEEICCISEELAHMRLYKDDEEIDRIRKAALLTDVGIARTIEALIQRLSEADATTEGQYAMRQKWTELFPDSEISGFGSSENASIDSLNVWCLSNNRIAYGCDCPRRYFPVQGDVLLPMAWAKVDGFHAETERAVLVGRSSDIRERAYAAVLEAREAIFKTLKPGIPFSLLYEKAADVFTAYGFGDILPGRVGHGVGCGAHEFPSLAPNSSLLLAPRMVFTVEPGVFSDKWGGVRHSDTILVTEEGYERLTKLPDGCQRIEL